MIQFKEKDHSVLLLKYICLCGEFPYRSLFLIPAQTLTLQRTVLKMKKEKYITVLGHGDEKTIRLTKKSFPIIEKYFPQLLDYYMSITDNHHFRGGSSNGNDIGKRLTWRKHRMAEALCMFALVETELLPFEKNTLHKTNFVQETIFSEERAFYSSVEIKNVDPEQKYKTDFTRMLGVYFSPGGFYCIYNTNKRLMKWNRQGELKAKLLVEDIVTSNYEPCLSKFVRADKAILFGENYDILERILSVNNTSENNFEFLSFDNVYKDIYYIPLTMDGIKQLEIMSNSDWADTIRMAILGTAEKRIYNVDCDKFENNKYTLLFLDCNIGRLNRFKQAKDINNKSKFEIICFPEQVDFIKNFFKNEIQISTVPIDSVLSIFQER